MSGCVYSNNKSWGDMTPREKQEARQNFEEIEAGYRDAFSDSHIQDQFALWILHTVEYAITHAEPQSPGGCPSD